MENTKHSNLLIHESSPYLLQHAHNPVNWHPWNSDTLEKAKNEDKMILVSIGYSACHWCHVMEHESFEDEEVAQVMNEHFICIKVDREERPDVDQVYMDAIQTISGRGGWPLNCFALPDGKPFWGATYFGRDQWLDILNNVVSLFASQRKKLKMQADDIFEGISKNSFVGPKGSSDSEHKISDADEMAYILGNRVDREEGGFQGAPKFPMPNNFLFLLRYHFFSGNPEALELVELTLEKMARGGIYDQLGGGFARYSVDDRWHIPHFEKMLYDNAQMISLYAETYQLKQNPMFEKVLRESMDFIDREMTSPEGGFYSALDADSEGVEGKFYVWSQKEFEEACGDKHIILSEYFGIGGVAYWEDGNHVLIQAKSAIDLAIHHQMSIENVEAILAKGKKLLFDARAPRSRPGLDDKILTSWNALMLKGCLDAYRALGDKKFLKMALRNANFLSENVMSPEGRLNRSYKAGKASIEGFLEDYSFLMEAYISVYELTFDESWIVLAKKMADFVIKHFYDSASGMFYYTSDLHKDNITRKVEVVDNVTPASTSALAKSLHTLGLFYELPKYLKISDQMLSMIHEKMLKFPAAFSNWGILFLRRAFLEHTAVITGPSANELRDELIQQYRPNTLLAGGVKQSQLPITRERWSDSKTQIYVCAGQTCQLPVDTVRNALPFLKVKQ